MIHLVLLSCDSVFFKRLMRNLGDTDTNQNVIKVGPASEWLRYKNPGGKAELQLHYVQITNRFVQFEETAC